MLPYYKYNENKFGSLDLGLYIWSMEKMLRESERKFGVKLNHSNEFTEENVNRLKIQISEDLHYTITRDMEGGLIINKTDYNGSSTITIFPRVSNEIIIL